MRLRTTNLNLIERQLRAKLLQMPHFFQDAPVVLDLGEILDSLHLLPLPSLVHVLRSMRVVPVGATGVPEEGRDFVRSAGLTLVQTGAGKPREEAPARDPRARRPRPSSRAPHPARRGPTGLRWCCAPPCAAARRSTPARPTSS
jgi:septum formation inhibitor MinC